MANVAVTNTFVAGTTAVASQVNTNFSDIVTWLNNRNAGSDTWGYLKVTATVANPVVITSSAATTEVSIDNTATDGDPLLTLKLGGSTMYSLGVDDSDSDAFKIGTTDLTTSNSIRIPVAGAQVQFNAGSVGAPGVAFIGYGATGIYSSGANQIGFSSNGTCYWKILSTGSIYCNTEAQIFIGDGSKTAPSISWNLDSDTGIWKIGSGIFGVSCNDTEIVRFTPTEVQCAKRIIAQGGIVGTATNDDAATGNVGEFVRSSVVSGSAVSSTGSTQWFDVTSISLTAGDWDVSGIVTHVVNGATQTAAVGGISITSGNSTSGLVEGDNWIEATPPTANNYTASSIPCWRLSIASSQTVYLKAKEVFSAGTPKAFGRVSARRVR